MNIEIKGLQVHYKVSGDGPDMILLHGWGASIHSFERVHHNYENHFKVYTLDFPGFGKSEEPKSVWGISDYSDFFCAFVASLGIKNPIVMGHSFGGRVAILSASKIKYRKLVLIDSAGIKPKRNMKYYFKVYSFKTVKNLAKLPGLKGLIQPKIDAYRKKVGSADYKNASPIMRGILSKVVNEDLRKELPGIKCPTLLVWGDQDTATPLRDAHIMEKAIPDAGLVVFEGVGHFSYLEAYPKFIRVIDSFLAEEMGGLKSE